jgi:CRP-like cAMP-binding protein
MTNRKKILIIEDNQDIRENLVEILELSGYKTYDCENGKLGYDLAIHEKPDLIICDIMMPEMDGYALLHLIRKNEKTGNIPFIFLTAKTDRSDFRKGMELGADDFITKPFEDMELLNAIESRFKRNEVYQKAVESHKMHGNIDFKKIFIDSGNPVKLLKKQILFEEGKYAKNVYLVLSGKIKCVKLSEEGKEFIVDIFGANDYMGYIPLLGTGKYEETAVVLEDAELVSLPKDDFLRLIFSDVQIANQLIKTMVKNVKEKEDKLVIMAYGNLRKRVAKTLIEIDDKFSSTPSDNPLEIKREELASYIGIATESLIRTLSDFKSEKLIDTREGKIVILNKDKLKHLLF